MKLKVLSSVADFMLSPVSKKSIRLIMYIPGEVCLIEACTSSAFKSLSERHPKRGWTARAHQARAGVSLPNFLPFPRIVGGPVRGICEFDTLFSIFSCCWYPKRVMRRVVKIYPFYTFLFTRMMYRPQWDIPPRVYIILKSPSYTTKVTRSWYFVISDILLYQ